jgi:hypothetical protein
MRQKLRETPTSKRHFRAYLGVLVIIVDLVVFFVDKIIQNEPFSWVGMAVYALFFLGGFALIDKDAALDIIESVVDKLPLIGKK